ncbi:MAG: hypothetical protein V7703_11675 [Hyphomicrobiales bacterium]
MRIGKMGQFVHDMVVAIGCLKIQSFDTVLDGGFGWLMALATVKPLQCEPIQQGKNQ